MTRQQMIEEACRRKGDPNGWRFHLELCRQYGGPPVASSVVDDVRFFFNQIAAEQFCAMQPN